MSHNQTGRKIGIYKELAVGILVSVIIAVAVAMGVFYICKSRGILIEVEEDCSQYKKKCDLQVMELVRELDSALNTAMEEIESTESQEENITDAMRYLMQNNKMPFVPYKTAKICRLRLRVKKEQCCGKITAMMKLCRKKADTSRLTNWCLIRMMRNVANIFSCIQRAWKRCCTTLYSGHRRIPNTFIMICSYGQPVLHWRRCCF